MNLPRPVIIGCRTTDFPKEQLEKIKSLNPLGMIIFAEACKSGPEKIKQVIKQFRDTVGRQDAPILIDNEGGFVYRFKKEFDEAWRQPPKPSVFGEIALIDINDAKRATFLNSQLIAFDLRSVGITVNCAPVLDVVSEETYDGDITSGEKKLHATSAKMKTRCFSDNVNIVIALGKASADGYIDQGVVPIIKHIPGLGRAKADTHYNECRIDHSFDTLSKQDFESFKALNDYPVAMTAHVKFTKIDENNSVTVSKKIIQEVIRDYIGFKGLIVADTVEMNAIWPEGFNEKKRDNFGMCLPLPGTMKKISQMALNAGVDILLHSACSDDFGHVVELLEASPNYTEKEFKRSISLISPNEPGKFNKFKAESELENILHKYQNLGIDI